MSQKDDTVDVLRLSNNVLDCVFTSRATKRPTYATTTHGSNTTLWRVKRDGTLNMVAVINWATGKNGKEVSITVDGEERPVKDVFRQRGGFLSSKYYSFTAGDQIYKWKSLIGSTGSDKAVVGMHGDLTPNWQQWTCQLPTSPKSRTLAAFFPPQSGVVRSELSLYNGSLDPINAEDPASPLVLDTLVLTAILLETRRTEYKTVQSQITVDALQASLIARSDGSLPPYLPSAANRDEIVREEGSRWRRPQTAIEDYSPSAPARGHLRRGHSATVSPVAPPAYRPNTAG